MKPVRLFLVLFLTLIFTFSNNAFCKYKFKSISVTDGLPHSIVLKVFQDAEGYMWFGTGNGLSRYDGKYFKNFIPDIKDPKNTLPYHIINDIVMDNKHNLWILTQRGVCVFDHKLQKIINLSADNNYGSIFQNLSLAIKILVTDDSLIWIKGYHDLHKIDLKAKNRTDYKFTNEGNIRSIVKLNNVIYILTSRSLYKVNSKNEPEKIDLDLGKINTGEGKYANLSVADNALIIVIQGAGFVFYNPVSSSVERFIPDVWGIPENDFASIVLKVVGDKLWFSFHNRGLHIYDLTKNTAESYYQNNFDPFAIKSNYITNIFEDRNGQVWLGTYKSGICYVDYKFDRFQSFYNVSTDPASLPLNYIMSFYDDEDNLWLGSFGGEIIRYNKIKKQYTIFKNGSSNQKGFNYGGAICKILKDKEGNLFFFSWFNSIHYLSKQKNPDYSASTLFFSNIMDDWQLMIDRWAIRDAVIDDNDNLWIASFTNGILRYNLKTKNQEYYKDEKLGAKTLETAIWCLAKGKSGQIWAGTEDKGIIKINSQNNDVKFYRHISDDSSTISSNHVKCIYVDKDGTLWIGTGGAGLCHFDPLKEKVIKTYTVEYGLSNNVIYGILEDNKNNLWLTTDNGLTCFNKKTKECRIFTPSNGLQNLEFAINSYYKNNEGEFFIGGAEGFDRFFPDKITLNPFPPIPVITAFRIANKIMEPGKEFEGRIIFDKNLNQTEELNLTWKEKDFSFFLGALHFTDPLKNKIAYKLEGYHTDWIYTTLKDNEVSFSNLPGGSYTLVVKVANADGIWCKDPLQLKINIIPPFWRTWWFYLSCIVIVGMIVGLWFKIRIQSIKRQNQVLEEKVVERTREIIEKNNEILAQNEEIISINEELAVQQERLQEVYEEVTYNIQTAKRIQNGILPRNELLDQCFKEYFVIYKPKDIVSGDFYWFSERFGKLYIAAVDCTGHGVSGAFMSLIGKCLLDQILIEDPLANAADILNALSRLLVKTLQQDLIESGSKDGMDIAICVIDSEEEIMHFAGANNPLFIKKQNELEVIKGDPFGIGLIKGKPSEGFTNHIINLEEGDAYYIFSDGYVSQFGGNSGEDKFKINKFREMIKDATGSLASQKEEFEEILSQWQKSIPQTDDILVIGFKI